MTKRTLTALLVVSFLIVWMPSALPVSAQQPVVIAKGDNFQFQVAAKGGNGGSGSGAPSIPTFGQTWNHGNTCTVNTWSVSGNSPSSTPSAITVGIDSTSGNAVKDAENAIGEWGPGTGSAITNFVNTYGSSGLITTTISNLCFVVNKGMNNQWSGGSGGGSYDIHIAWVSQFSGQPNVLGETQTYYFIGTYVIAFMLITIALSPGCCGTLSDAALQTVIAHEFGHAIALGHSTYPGSLSCDTCDELMYKYIYGGSTTINLSTTTLVIRPSNLDVYALSSVRNHAYNNGPGVFYWFSLSSSLAKPGKSQTDPWTWANI